METMQPGAVAAAARNPSIAVTETPARAARMRARTVRPRASAAHTERRPDGVDRLATALGWLSIALGAAALLAPRRLDRAIGAGTHALVTRACGMRELAAGVGLLTQADPVPWLWSRVAGDAMDLALIGAAMARADDDEQARLVGAALAVAGVAALDAWAARRAMSNDRRSAPGVVRRDGSVRVDESLAINRPPDACYAMWRDLAGLPRFMQHLQSVEVRDATSHWVARGPAGTSLEWDAQITRDEPNALLSWRSIEGSEVPNAGAVRFVPAPAGRGTIVSVTLQYQPPGGPLGQAVATLFGAAPQQQVREDLRRFKRLIEAGEIPTIEGQPHGRRSLWYTAIEGGNR